MFLRSIASLALTLTILPLATYSQVVTVTEYASACSAIYTTGSQSVTVIQSTVTVQPVSSQDAAANDGAPFVLAVVATSNNSKKKRQTETSWLTYNGNTTTSLALAGRYEILNEQLMSTNGSYVSTSYNVLNQAFSISAYVEPINTIFSVLDGILNWTNPDFSNGTAQFYRLPANLLDNASILAKFIGPMEPAREWSAITLYAQLVSPATSVMTSILGGTTQNIIPGMGTTGAMSMSAPNGGPGPVVPASGTPTPETNSPIYPTRISTYVYPPPSAYSVSSSVMSLNGGPGPVMPASTSSPAIPLNSGPGPVMQASTSSSAMFLNSGLGPVVPASTSSLLPLGSVSNTASTIASSTYSASSAPACPAAATNGACSDPYGNTYAVQTGTMYTGTVSERLSQPNLNNCLTSCDTTPGCVAVNYDGATCSYFSAVTGAAPDPGSNNAAASRPAGEPVNTVPPTSSSVASTSAMMSNPLSIVSSPPSSTTNAVLPIATSTAPPSVNLAISSSLGSSSGVVAPPNPTTTTTTHSSSSSLLRSSSSIPPSTTISSASATSSGPSCSSGQANYQYTDSNSVTYTVYCGQDNTYESFGNGFYIATGGFSACFAACDETTGCDGFTYTGTSTGYCYFKAAMGSLVPAAATVVSGFKTTQSSPGLSSSSPLPTSSTSSVQAPSSTSKAPTSSLSPSTSSKPSSSSPSTSSSPSPSASAAASSTAAASSSAAASSTFSYVLSSPTACSFGDPAGYDEDDSYCEIDLPFSMVMYGQSSTQTFPSTNGLLAIQYGSAQYQAELLPDSAIPNNTACPFFDDLELYGSGVSPVQGIFYQLNTAMTGVTYEYVLSRAGSPTETYHFTVGYDSTVPGVFTYTYYAVGQGDDGEFASVGIQGITSSGSQSAVQYSFQSADITPGLIVSCNTVSGQCTTVIT